MSVKSVSLHDFLYFPATTFLPLSFLFRSPVCLVQVWPFFTHIHPSGRLGLRLYQWPFLAFCSFESNSNQSLFILYFSYNVTQSSVQYEHAFLTLWSKLSELQFHFSDFNLDLENNSLLQLMKFTNNFFMNFDNNFCPGDSFLDLRKAFDLDLPLDKVFVVPLVIQL